jgi:hypothetical protein
MEGRAGSVTTSQLPEAWQRFDDLSAKSPGALSGQFAAFVDGLWLTWRSATRRPDALRQRPVPRLAGHSTRYENRVNTIGLLFVIVFAVTGLVGVVSLAFTRVIENEGLVMLLFEAGLLASALLPRTVLRNWGRWYGGLRGVVRGVARAHALETMFVGDNNDGAQCAFGRLDDVGFCLFSRSVDAQRSACHTLVAMELVDDWGVALQVEPKIDLMGRLGQLGTRKVKIESEEFAEQASMSEAGEQATDSAATAPALLDSETRRQLLALVRDDTVLRVIGGRLEAYRTRVHWTAAELESWIDAVRDLRGRLQHALSLAVPMRLLEHVMNEPGEFRYQCLTALRDHFPESPELERAEAFMRDHSGGQLSFVDQAETGAVSLVDEQGGLSVAVDAGEDRDVETKDCQRPRDVETE